MSYCDGDDPSATREAGRRSGLAPWLSLGGVATLLLIAGICRVAQP